MKYIFILSLVFVSHVVIGQELQKPIDTVQVYGGGRDMYSSINLILLSDSSYRYQSWLKGMDLKDSGEWRKIDSSKYMTKI